MTIEFRSISHKFVILKNINGGIFNELYSRVKSFAIMSRSRLAEISLSHFVKINSILPN